MTDADHWGRLRDPHHVWCSLQICTWLWIFQLANIFCCHSTDDESEEEQSKTFFLNVYNFLSNTKIISLCWTYVWLLKKIKELQMFLFLISSCVMFKWWPLNENQCSCIVYYLWCSFLDVCTVFRVFLNRRSFLYLCSCGLEIHQSQLGTVQIQSLPLAGQSLTLTALCGPTQTPAGNAADGNSNHGGGKPGPQL